jgi:hypothetical protein
LAKRSPAGKKQPRFSEKLPPHNQEAEESVIASLVLSADDFMDEVVQFLKPGHFHDERNGWCFEAMCNLRDRGVPVDEISVNQELERIGKLDEVGGLGYLSLLVSRLTISLHCVYWAHLVHNCFILRRMINIAGMIAAKAYEGEVNSVEEVLQVGQDIYNTIWQEVGETPFVITDMIKTTSDPPQYCLKVNGRRVRANVDELVDQNKFRRLVMAQCNFLPPKMKDEEWTERLNLLLKAVKEMSAPPEISTDHTLWQAAVDIIRSVPTVDTEDEFKSGYPIRRGTHIYVHGSAFIALWTQKIRQTQGLTPNVSVLWSIMNTHGGKKSQIRFGEGFKRAWQLPASLLDGKGEEAEDGDDSDLLF